MTQQLPAKLLRTSSASDVTSSNGLVTIAGYQSVLKSRISNITQITGKAEVVQVVTVGATAYTPVGGKAYTVLIGDTNRVKNGVPETLRPYTYVTPATITDIGANAAAQREYIHGQIVAKVNDDSSNYVSAVSLGSGNGFTVTDDAGYYPVWNMSGNNRLGASTVKPVSNSDDSGFSPTNYSITTPAVYSFGVGADLLSSVPVIDPLYGGVISGYFAGSPYGFAPKTITGLPAVSGQSYDAFIVEYYEETSAYGGNGDAVNLVPKNMAVFVDNGTGSSTANRNGFLAFEKEMRKLLVEAADTSNSYADFYDSPILFQGPTAGAVPSGTAGNYNKIISPYGSYGYTIIGTQTATTPTEGNAGLIYDQDLTDTEGAEYTPSLFTNGKKSFIVGKSPYSFIWKGLCADHTDANLYVTLRKKAAHSATFTSYTDLAGIGFLADLVYTWGNLNGGTMVATNTTVVPVDSAVEEFAVFVDINGVVTVKYNNTTYPVYSVGTTPLVLDAGDEIIANVRYTNNSTGDPDLTCNYFMGVASDSWLK